MAAYIGIARRRRGCYQKRKKRKTSTALFYRQARTSFTISDPVTGNHNDLYRIEMYFDQITKTLKKADIAIEGLLMQMPDLTLKTSESIVKVKILSPILLQ